MFRTIPLVCFLSGCVAGITYDPNADEDGCVEGASAQVMVVGIGAQDVGKDCAPDATTDA